MIGWVVWTDDEDFGIVKWTVWVDGGGSLRQVCLEVRGSIDWLSFLRGSSFLDLVGFSIESLEGIAEDLGSEIGWRDRVDRTTSRRE